MKTKTFSYLALVGLTACAVLNWSCRSYLFDPKVVPKTTADVRQTLEKCSSEKELQAEVDRLFLRLGDKKQRPILNADLSTTPGLARFGKALSSTPYSSLYIVPSDYDEIGVPSHVRIRFGEHFHYQYVLIFRTGSDLSSIRSPYEQVTKNIYFRP